ncbi:hypothetical protein DAPPUDRAFT_326821 [Daphnia pulex]|uniref:Uncharacterized protein n=1 Tax=Daphnia pulex TaxID=6669 RepID=E9H8V9_DAPPU|nr:hypothetical protein DAPPUDRAFT_326821 [Daphnia pulex]|eukprot:EFX71826.1 hypothetical protein DAPPUDRAFT_326821 [Daphnia pulex]
MRKNLRTTYVVRKATKAKNVFIKHKLISKLVLNIIRVRSGAKDADLTEETIWKKKGPAIFANAADENGGIEVRKLKTAREKAALAKILV